MSISSDPNEELAVAAAAGDAQAWVALCEQFDPYITGLALKFTRMASSMAVEDLRQESAILLLDLCKTWKPGCGTKFGSYLMTWLPNHLQKRVDSTDRMVRAPRHAAVKHRNELRSGQNPSGHYVLINHTQIESVVGLGMEDIGDDERAQAVVDPAWMTDNDPLLQAQISELFGYFSALDERTRHVFALYLAWGLSFLEIGEIVGLSHQGAANVFDKGIDLLRQRMGITLDSTVAHREARAPRVFGKRKRAAGSGVEAA